MIKINGPNYYQGSGDYYLFGYLGYGNGIGKGIRSQYLFYSSTGNGISSYLFYYNSYSGNGWGDGCYFGGGTGNGIGDGYVFGDIKGSGNSYFSCKFKEGFLNDN